MSRKRMRLPNGHGSVYKLSGRRRKPYAAVITVGWDDEGKQIRELIGTYKTRSEGLDALAEYRKSPGLQSDMTFADVWEQWSGTSAYTKLSKASRRAYDLAWSHLSDPLGKIPITEIRKSHLQAVIDHMSSSKDKGGLGLGHASCHKVKVLAGILLKHVMADNIVGQNYAEFVILPAKPERKRDTFTDLEIKAITKLAKTDIWAGTVLIMIYTGMRISEMTGLTKFNVDMENQIITGGIKTDAGKDRIVPISPKIQSHVMYWYNQPGDHVITLDGKPIRSDYYRKELYYPALERAGVRKLQPHKARHTFGTLLDKAGVNTKHIQELMGHADYSTTANIYTHPELDLLRKAVERL